MQGLQVHFLSSRILFLSSSLQVCSGHLFPWVPPLHRAHHPPPPCLDCHRDPIPLRNQADSPWQAGATLVTQCHNGVKFSGKTAPLIPLCLFPQNVKGFEGEKVRLSTTIPFQTSLQCTAYPYFDPCIATLESSNLPKHNFVLSSAVWQ